MQQILDNNPSDIQSTFNFTDDSYITYNEFKQRQEDEKQQQQQQYKGKANKIMISQFKSNSKNVSQIQRIEINQSPEDNKESNQTPQKQKHSILMKQHSCEVYCNQFVQDYSKTEKFVYLQLENKKTIIIKIDQQEEANLTCGWLLSEAIRQMQAYYIKNNEHFDGDQVVALFTKDNNYTLDSWLVNFDKSISVLKDGQVLLPFYKDPTYKIEENKSISIQHFKILKLLGKGGYSKVYLAKSKDEGKLYAIKVINKEEFKKKKSDFTLYNECNVLNLIRKSPFLVNLHWHFENKTNLFLVMDFCPGGELFYYLNQQYQKFNEDQVKFYFAEILLSLDELHQQNIIYRDLKPENILLDIDGHVKLADFGISKINLRKDSKTYTFCGTVAYMPKEMIQKAGHNYTYDYYTLGVLLYELIAGIPPFFSISNSEQMMKAVEKQIQFPQNLFSPELRQMILSLADKEQSNRLGSEKGINQIMEHPWCQDINWQDAKKRLLVPPIKPNLYEINFDRAFLTENINYDNFICEYEKSIKNLNENENNEQHSIYIKNEQSNEQQQELKQQQISSNILKSIQSTQNVQIQQVNQPILQTVSYIIPQHHLKHQQNYQMQSNKSSKYTINVEQDINKILKQNDNLHSNGSEIKYSFDDFQLNEESPINTNVKKYCTTMKIFNMQNMLTTANNQSKCELINEK